jgi:hypothetical protein
MRFPRSLISLAVVLLHVANSRATAHYVDLGSPAPSVPYTDWATAARTIQDAVDASADGDVVLVTNGAYQTGSRTAGSAANRLVVTNHVTVQSVNGAGATIIQGFQDPATITTNTSIRCVYLGSNATLIGFTLSGGASQSGVGRDSGAGGGVFGESTNALVSDCVISGNAAYWAGGGTYHVTLNHSSIVHNWTTAPGSNTAGGPPLPLGGGAFACVLNSCTISNNSSFLGGGVLGGVLNNCVVVNNCASNSTLGGAGGGVAGDVWSGAPAVANNCLFMANFAASVGGAAAGCTLNNCTVLDNTASTNGGGVYSGTMNNCIVYYNSAPEGANWFRAENELLPISLNSSCTTPMPTNGINNFTNEPLLATPTQLGAGSPCIGAGSAAYVSGVDFNGNPWAAPPSVGCAEYNAAAAGPLSVAIRLFSFGVPANFTQQFIPVISGSITNGEWLLDDGTIVTNTPFIVRSWPAFGDYPVVFRGYNNSFPDGVSSTVTVHVASTVVHYVVATNASPVPPFTSWETAATNINDAIDAVFNVPNAMVLVSNGLYKTGGRLTVGSVTNRVAVTKPILVESVNGALATAIEGFRLPTGPYTILSTRCVYLTNGASLVGFTLTNGSTRQLFSSGRFRLAEDFGGGAWYESSNVLIADCVFVNNTASGGGAGAFGHSGSSTLSLLAGFFPTDSSVVSNCTFLGNSVLPSATFGSGGGAACDANLIQCTISNNQAATGAAVYSGTLSNCTVIGNTISAGFDSGVTYHTIVSNSVLIANLGTAASLSTVYDSLIASNSAANTNGGGASGSTLVRCMLIGNSAGFEGGGAYQSTLTNCQLSGNSANKGGGAAESTLDRCTVTGNTATFGGGVFQGTLTSCLLWNNLSVDGAGAYQANLKGCTVVSNQAVAPSGGPNMGGGLYFGTATNCIIWGNIIRTSDAFSNYFGTTLGFCMTAPLPPGPGNIANEPLFVDAASDFHLQSASPCINSGNNAFVTGNADLDGYARITASTVDIGAYEFQSPTSVISYAWLQQFGLPTDGTADFTDSDHDGLNNSQEWRVGTSPIDALSVLKMLTVSSAPPGKSITWRSANGINYFLQRGSDLTAQPPFSTIQTNIPGQPGTTTYTDTNAMGPGPFFYRVGVQTP